MAKIVCLVAAFLSLASAAAAQFPNPKTIISDEFHFMALFPNEPKQANGVVNTRFGSGKSHRWFLQQSDISYEVSVIDFSDLSIEMNSKSLHEYYGAICQDFAEQFGKPSCHAGGEDIEDEHGDRFSFQKANEVTTMSAWLARQRLYLVFVTYDKKGFQAHQQWWRINDFFDNFLLIKKTEDGKTYTLGLPISASQNIKGTEP